MKLSFPLLPLALATALVPGIVSAADSGANIDNVLAKYVTASGGKANLEKVKTLTMKGTMEMPAMGLNSEFEMQSKAPNKQLVKIDLPGMGAALDACDGTVAWSQNAMQGVREKTGDELAKARRDAEFQRPLTMKKIFPDLAFKGVEQVGGEPASVLESKPSPGSLERFYFSQKSGLLVQQQSTLDTPQGQLTATVNQSDYKAVDGVLYPHLIKTTISVGGQEMALSLKVAEIKHNQPMDDKIFAKPAK